MTANVSETGRERDRSPDWPLWEVFLRSKGGLDHKHCGSLHAPDHRMAISYARDVYTRRQEGISIWVVQSQHVIASDPNDKAIHFETSEDKEFRHPSFYVLPEGIDHI